MRLIIQNQDLSELVEKITWSGDKNQVARRLSFTYLYTREDSNIPAVSIEEGNTVGFYDDTGNELFLGVVIKRTREESGITISVDSVDLAWYTSKNKVYGVYQGSAAEITRSVCLEFDIKTGELLEGGSKTEVVSTGDKSIYGVIQAAYQAAGMPSYIHMTGQCLNVLPEGNTVAAVLSGSSNVTGATYTSSIENMVNKVVLLNEQSKYAGEVENTEDKLAYGVMQETYQLSAGKDVSEAQRMLKRIEQSGTITAVGDTACISGRAVYVVEVSSKITGLFTIQSDSHSFLNGQHTMTLGLKFEEVV